jgi:hypothetical protein
MGGNAQLFRYGAPRPNPRPVLVDKQFEAEVIRGDVMYALQFPPLPDTANRQLYFELSAPSGQPGNSVTAYWQRSEPYAEGTAYWAGTPVAADLVFVLRFRCQAGSGSVSGCTGNARQARAVGVGRVRGRRGGALHPLAAALVLGYPSVRRIIRRSPMF